MKSLLSLVGGGSIGHLWKKIPGWIKAPTIFGAGILAAAELNLDLNHSWVAHEIFGGQAAQGTAQVVDPVATRKAMEAGKPVSGAERLVAVQYEGGDADARQKAATAVAANESEQEILAKKAKGIKLTSTEELRLKEMEIKRQELRIRTAEAQMREAESTAAIAKALADKKTAEFQARMIDSMNQDSGKVRSTGKEIQWLFNGGHY